MGNRYRKTKKHKSTKQKKNGYTFGITRSSNNKRKIPTRRLAKFGAGGLPFDLENNLGIAYIAPGLG